MKVKLKITETFERIVTVKAKTKNDAIVNVANKYNGGKSIHNDNGLVHFKIELYEEN